MNGAIDMDYVDMPLGGAFDRHHNRPYSEFHLKSDLAFDEFPFVDFDKCADPSALHTRVGSL